MHSYLLCKRKQKYLFFYKKKIFILFLTQHIYKEASKSFMSTGYSLPFDTPLALQAKANNVTTSNVRVHHSVPHG